MTETPQHLMTPNDMLAAMPAGAVAIEHRTGETWNDGGHWHTLVARLPDNTHILIAMDSDYNGDLVTSQYDYVPSLKEQLAVANCTATDQQAEIERLRAALECAKDYVTDASTGIVLYRGKSDISQMAADDLVFITAALEATP